MKRVKVLILSVLLVLALMPCAVYADMGAPMMLSADCVVTNPEGAVYYLWSEVEDAWIAAYDRIPYGTQLSVTGEFEDWLTVDGENVGAVGSVYYDDVYVYVLLSDVTANEYGEPLEGAQPLSEAEERIVIAKEGVNVYAGPSVLYEKIGVIPYGSTIKFTDGDVSEDFLANAFNYGSSEEISGWIETYTLEGSKVSLAKRLDNGYAGVIEVVEDDVCLRSWNEENPVDLTGVIPKGTTLAFDYYFYDYDGSYALVTYNGTEGFVRFKTSIWNPETDKYDVEPGVLVYMQDRYVITEADCMLYSTLCDKSSSAKTISGYNIFEVAAVYEQNTDNFDGCNEWVLVNYEGQDYYILFEGYSMYGTALHTDALYKADLSDGTFTVYKEHSLSSEIIAQGVSCEDLYICDFYYDDDGDEDYVTFYYVVGPEYSGWANGEYLYYGDYAGEGCMEMLAKANNTKIHAVEESVVSKGDTESDPVDEEQIPADDTNKDTDVKDDETDRTIVSPKSDRSTLILIAAGVVIVAITAVVVIKLIGKKKQ